MKKNISDNTGKGADRKGTKKDGLRWPWAWVMQCNLSMAPKNDKRRLPCQTCYAIKETTLGEMKFEAVDWHDRYEALVYFNNERLSSGDYYQTRAKAQLGAEKNGKIVLETLLREVYG